MRRLLEFILLANSVEFHLTCRSRGPVVCRRRSNHLSPSEARSDSVAAREPKRYMINGVVSAFKDDARLTQLDVVVAEDGWDRWLPLFRAENAGCRPITC